MSEYYLMSQLPSLDGVSDNLPLPITEERFLELCHRFLGKKARDEVDRLTLAPARELESSSSALIAAWNGGERDLRLALGKARADKLKKPFDAGDRILPVPLLKLASAAVETESPLEAERLLDGYRLAFLETLRPMDAFSEEFVFYYGLKLKLLLRARCFDDALGEEAYRNIYRSVVDGEGLEAKQ
ncbi:MAG: DUF2764 family protein [Ruminococcaceae bacterium]|nr:DUF2764 family protein [Oscillospiraceae bacterium]